MIVQAAPRRLLAGVTGAVGAVVVKSATSAGRLATLLALAPKEIRAPVITVMTAAAVAAAGVSQTRPGIVDRNVFDLRSYTGFVIATLAAVLVTFLATADRAPNVITVLDTYVFFKVDRLAATETDVTSSAQGHISKDCTQPQKRACYTCGSEGFVHSVLLLTETDCSHFADMSPVTAPTKRPPRRDNTPGVIFYSSCSLSLSQ